MFSIFNWSVIVESRKEDKSQSLQQYYSNFRAGIKKKWVLIQRNDKEII